MSWFEDNIYTEWRPSFACSQLLSSCQAWPWSILVRSTLIPGGRSISSTSSSSSPRIFLRLAFLKFKTVENSDHHPSCNIHSEITTIEVWSIVSEFFKLLYLFSLNTNLPSTFVSNKTDINIINNENTLSHLFGRMISSTFLLQNIASVEYIVHS